MFMFEYRIEPNVNERRTLEKSVLLMATTPMNLPSFSLHTVNNNKPVGSSALFHISFFVETLVETSTISLPNKK